MATCCTYHRLKYLSPNAQTKKKDKSHTKEPTFRKMKVYGKRGQENGPKAEKDNTEIATGLDQRTREEIYKSGIKLKGGRHQKSPGLPPGLGQQAHRTRWIICETTQLRQQRQDQLDYLFFFQNYFGVSLRAQYL